ncbi:MAG: NlpC/P60 family protein, partial [Armatimonadetes bacterium]|nr:NlpC/P60 family protein [Armatimonadota bacterium]
DAIGHTPHGAFRPIHFPRRGIAYVRTAAITDLPDDGFRCHRSEKLRLHRAAVLHDARRLVGVPYLWGGRTPFGIDCSGFTQLVFRLSGVALPRDAYQQADWPGLAPVSESDIAPGDLVFFGGDLDPRGRGITHVGIALEPPLFIHSAGGIGVTISSLLNEPYARNLRRAGRVQP